MTRHPIDRDHGAKTGARTRRFVEKDHRDTPHPATAALRRKPRGLSGLARLRAFMRIARAVR